MSKDKAGIMRYLVTLGAIAGAGLVLANMFQEYLFQPWTRDGHVRAQIIKITPRVGGPIVDLPILDNQRVSKGELLFKIDPRTFELAIEQAEAKLKQAQASEDSQGRPGQARSGSVQERQGRNLRTIAGEKGK